MTNKQLELPEIPAAARAEGFAAGLAAFLDRGYLAGLDRGTVPEPETRVADLAWVRVDRLPVPPSQADSFDLLPRWQTALTALHGGERRFVFLLLHTDGQTVLYLGVRPTSSYEAKSAGEYLTQAVRGPLPGTELTRLDYKQAADRLSLPIGTMSYAAALTGLPSMKKVASAEELQTFDEVAFGLRGIRGANRDFAVVVVAEPIPDADILDAVGTLRSLGNDIHRLVSSTVSEGTTKVRTETSGAIESLTEVKHSPGSFLAAAAAGMCGGLNRMVDGDRTLVGKLATNGLLASFGANPALFRGLTSAAASSFQVLASMGQRQSTAGTSTSVANSTSESTTVQTQRIDKVAQYCERLCDTHVVRMLEGRSSGFWRVGSYVLSSHPETTAAVAGMLRSMQAGEVSHIEPLRVNLFPFESKAAEHIRRFDFVPLPMEFAGEGNALHPIPMYEGLLTPMTTAELSVATSLPRREVPGMRVSRTAVRFSSNPPPVTDEGRRIRLGEMLDLGVPVGLSYEFGTDSLVKHALVAGTTGSGKTTTCRRLLCEVGNAGIPWLVIEPAKEEYARWAIRNNLENEELPEGDRRPQIKVFTANGRSIDGVPTIPLRLNLFHPADVGGTVDLGRRVDRLSTLFRGTLPLGDVLPLIIGDALIAAVCGPYGDKALIEPQVPKPDGFPLLGAIQTMGQLIIRQRGYGEIIRQNLMGALTSRIHSMRQGLRGQVIETVRSTPYDDLFGGPAVVSIGDIVDPIDRTLIMGLVLFSLIEYRSSSHRTDPKIRAAADAGKLLHLTLVEEAHRLLPRPAPGDLHATALLSEMFVELLSEIRAYGEGIVVVDQVPGRLIPDAIKNTNLKIVHRMVAEDDRYALASGMGLRPDQQATIATLTPGQAIVYGDFDESAAWVRVSGVPVNGR